MTKKGDICVTKKDNGHVKDGDRNTYIRKPGERYTKSATQLTALNGKAGRGAGGALPQFQIFHICHKAFHSLFKSEGPQRKVLIGNCPVW